MEVCACPSMKPPPLEGGILLTQPYAWVSMNSALVCGFLCTSERTPSTQQFHIPPWRIVTLAFLYTPAQKDALFSNVAACRGQRERLQPPELGLKK